MALFGFGKKKEEKTKVPTCACSCGEVQEKKVSECCCDTETTDNSSCCCGSNDGISSIKVLGAGCKSCHEQYENAKTAISNMGFSVEVEYITDMEQVMSYGVMSMPALVVNEKVVCMGKVLKPADVEKLLHKLGY